MEQTFSHTWKHSNQWISIIVAVIVGEPFETESQELTGKQNIHKPHLSNEMDVVDEFTKKAEEEIII